MATYTTIRLDPAAVRGISRNFLQHSADIRGLSAEIGATLTVVSATQFRGHVGDALMAKYNEEFVARFKTLWDKLNEISSDLENAAKAYEDFDEAASDYFEN